MPNTYYVTYGNNVLTAGSVVSAISVKFPQAVAEPWRK